MAVITYSSACRVDNSLVVIWDDDESAYTYRFETYDDQESKQQMPGIFWSTDSGKNWHLIEIDDGWKTLIIKVVKQAVEERRFTTKDIKRTELKNWSNW